MGIACKVEIRPIVRNCCPTGPTASGDQKRGDNGAHPVKQFVLKLGSRVNSSAWTGRKMSAAGLQPCSRMNCSMPCAIGFLTPQAKFFMEITPRDFQHN